MVSEQDEYLPAQQAESWWLKVIEEFCSRHCPHGTWLGGCPKCDMLREDLKMLRDKDIGECPH